mmetsp:Transcript_10771/g.35693  ORF Transcript_10771/g.35693 Transcript_10771/m.35693 type:complete len:200 (-) Transcript_10771:1229-1828(-)
MSFVGSSFAKYNSCATRTLATSSLTCCPRRRMRSWRSLEMTSIWPSPVSTMGMRTGGTGSLPGSRRRGSTSGTSSGAGIIVTSARIVLDGRGGVWTNAELATINRKVTNITTSNDHSPTITDAEAWPRRERDRRANPQQPCCCCPYSKRESGRGAFFLLPSFSFLGSRRTKRRAKRRCVGSRGGACCRGRCPPLWGRSG